MAAETSDFNNPTWQWSEHRDGHAAAFFGRDWATTAEDLLPQLDPRPREMSWLRQVHSNGVCAARAGLAGEGDALVSSNRGLALAVATADCVPVLLAERGTVAAIHAGWRGLEAGVVEAAVEAVDRGNAIEAWIGPAIGPCCYEIGDDVADRLRATGPAECFAVGPSGRHHADLQALARHQLRAAGVDQIRTIELCTRCESQRLDSYRRSGASAGRNWAVVWRT